MAEHINRQTAFNGRDKEYVSGTDMQQLGIEIRQRLVNAIIQLNGIDATALERLRQHFGLDDAPAQRVITTSNVMFLWTGPAQWLLISEQIEAGAIMTQLDEILACSDGTATDLSHGRVIVKVTGSQTRVLMAKGCPLDIESLAVGDCAATHLGEIKVIIHWCQENACELYASRSFAISLLEWLLDAAGEFGCRVTSDPKASFYVDY